MSAEALSRPFKRLADYLPPAFSIESTDLTFELDPVNTVVTAELQIRRLDSKVVELCLQGQQLELLSVQYKGHLLSADDYQLDDKSLRLTVQDDRFSLVIKTRLQPQANTALEGLYYANNTFCTQCEAEGFQRITYYLDRPDVLSLFSSSLIADPQQYPFLLSNGNKVEQRELTDGRRLVRWQDPFPKPCYLFALVAGDFDTLSSEYQTASGRTVQLEFYVEKGQGSKASFALESLKRAMRWDEERFGLEYDLERYMVVAVDFFNMGAMENKGLNVFNSKYVLVSEASATDKDFFNVESIIGHEYFHNWTGNRVTCRDWFQLSLKEGLTVFRDQEFSRDMGSATVNRIDAVQVIRTAQFAEDASPMAHPIRPEQVMEMNNFYTVTVYDKGAEVIRMLHTLLGEAGFQAGMRLYFQRHDGQAVTCDDFVQAMQDANQQDLTAFRRWYQQSGTPVLSVKRSYDADRRQLTLTLQQKTPPTADQAQKQPLVLPIRYQLLGSKRSSSELFVMTSAQASLTFDNVEATALPVVLEDFSAPVRLQHDYSDAELLRIATEASNGFARWDALQSCWLGWLQQAVAKGESYELPEGLFDFYQQLLHQPLTDLALTAELLKVPDYAVFAENFSPIPVDAILDAITDFRRQLSQRLAGAWLHCYQQQRQTTPDYHETNVGQRALKNRCLEFLALLPECNKTVLEQQYRNANTMTDQLAALKAAQQGGYPGFHTLMEDFGKAWQHDVLVLDKWFGLHASNPDPAVFAQIEALCQHDKFSWQNPNRVRAVFHAFTMLNPGQFHRLDGRGYALLTDTVIQLDGINPQVAARLVTPLLSWKRFDTERQSLLRAALERLADRAGISDDVFEKVSKALAS
ncbi:aminopeptidase N [Alkalimonas delamerensis]|uniref:Aminopeptidase N n=1 Tax=Alkalimonas delamerensis TaxID=265981 RepID=A0ABT9GNS1_9GAMM|nr:aminopeptidase N [Alkalimonas delamerensis]MDP4528564.1 aminopeptidase N [Alkalimonas delamerensis]